MYQQRGQFKRATSYRHQAYRIWQSLQLPLAALPFPEFQKRMLQNMLGDDWIERLIASETQMAWFLPLIGFVRLFVRSALAPIRWLQRRLKTKKIN
jgi:hypothetical protein